VDAEFRLPVTASPARPLPSGRPIQGLLPTGRLPGARPNLAVRGPWHHTDNTGIERRTRFEWRQQRPRRRSCRHQPLTDAHVA
jgi:hypothetical protein